MNTYRNLDLDETGVLVRAGRASLYGYYIYNNAVATRYVKVYDKATAPLSTDTPFLTLPIPATSAANLGLGAGCAIDGITLGFGLRATTGVADADVGAPAANDVVVNFFYQ